MLTRKDVKFERDPVSSARRFAPCAGRTFVCGKDKTGWHATERTAKGQEPISPSPFVSKTELAQAIVDRINADTAV